MDKTEILSRLSKTKRAVLEMPLSLEALEALELLWYTYGFFGFLNNAAAIERRIEYYKHALQR